MQTDHKRAVAYLRGLEWDGVCRLNDWCARYLGAPGDELTRRRGRAWMIGAVARAMQPGVKMDNALTLLAPTHGDAARAAFLAGYSLALGMAREYRGALATVRSVKQMIGAWIGMWAPTPAQVERWGMHALLSAQSVPKQRPVRWGFGFDEVPRTDVFIIGISGDRMARFCAANRRWWIVEVGEIDAKGLREVADQLWAEAVICYEAGEPWWWKEVGYGR